MKRNFFIIAVFLLLLNLNLCFAKGLQRQCRPPGLSEKPSADELMKAWFDIKFTRYADDVTYEDIDVI
ncbi:MAG: hypothetical protein LWW78_05520, partial [Deltaproteobacteria bacterium]|nr:hypothetical protein [Deltaproteobacteria bacterium]